MTSECTGLEVEYRIGLVTDKLRFESQSAHLKATLSKLLTYSVLRPTHLASYP